MNPFEITRHSLIAALRDASTILCGIQDDDFRSGEDALGLSSIGAHVRHVGDACDRFLDGLDRGFVDYDSRDRDVRFEFDRMAAIERLAALAARLEALDPAVQQVDLCVKHDAPEGSDDLRLRSSVERELMFLASHSVHHFALVAVLLRAKMIAVSPEFGMAVSTLRHLSRIGESLAPQPKNPSRG